MPRAKRSKVIVDQYFVLDTSNESIICVADTEAKALKEANYMAEADGWDESLSLILAKKISRLLIESHPKIVKA
jgi:sulfur relay (sulfurtransferase) DsrC/TusE family protein